MSVEDIVKKLLERIVLNNHIDLKLDIREGRVYSMLKDEYDNYRIINNLYIDDIVLIARINKYVEDMESKYCFLFPKILRLNPINSMNNNVNNDFKAFKRLNNDLNIMINFNNIMDMYDDISKIYKYLNENNYIKFKVE